MADHPYYFAFLLRLWKEKKSEPAIWRASLEDPYSGEQKGFATLEDLLAYLIRKTKPEIQKDTDKETE